jgi:hypothetical protein
MMGAFWAHDVKPIESIPAAGSIAFKACLSIPIVPAVRSLMLATRPIEAKDL